MQTDERHPRSARLDGRSLEGGETSHESTTDPEAELFRKGNSHPAKLY
jgi:hypothetical protein